MGCIETKLLYEEDDGIWLKLQGEDRKAFGPSKEMKVGIAYDGVTWEKCNGGKTRRTLNGKVAHAGFETAKRFRENEEGVIASRYDVRKIKQRIISCSISSSISSMVCNATHLHWRVFPDFNRKAGCCQSVLCGGQLPAIFCLSAGPRHVFVWTSVEKCDMLYQKWGQNPAIGL